MQDYKMTIGLEIHSELKTNSKMFCGCKNDQEENLPNKNICPVCMGLPGTLPAVNKEAIKKVLMVGKAVGGKIADFTEFDRKNYFYPDIPKGYQISQYKYPLVTGGKINNVKITRIHLEEDTAKSSHNQGDYSLVDFNRAGIPLMELVTEPVITSAKEAGDFGRELQLILRYLGVSDANMEKGQMRVEVNISVSNTDVFGTKVEVKNINSFRSAERAILYEFKRQVDLINSGGTVIQETRGYDETKNITFSQRTKEDSHDYRYFPDPDIPKFYINNLFDLDSISIPEMPIDFRNRYKNSFGIKDEDIEVYVNNRNLANLFEKTCAILNNNSKSVLVSNYITSDLVGFIKKTGIDASLYDSDNINPNNFSKLIELIIENKISSRGAKDTLKIMFDNGGDPEKIAKDNNFIQIVDIGLIENTVNKIIENNPVGVAEYKNGKESILQFLIGQTMKELKGAGNPESIKEMLIRALK